MKLKNSVLIVLKVAWIVLVVQFVVNASKDSSNKEIIAYKKLVIQVVRHVVM